MQIQGINLKMSQLSFKSLETGKVSAAAGKVGSLRFGNVRFLSKLWDIFNIQFIECRGYGKNS